MPVTTVGRSVWTDDSGGGTDGTIVRNAELQLIYDKIDALLAGAVTFGGLVSSEGFGTHSLSAGGTGGQLVSIRNTTAGVGNYSGVLLGNDTDASNCYLVGYSSAFTPSGIAAASGGALVANGAGGLSIAAVHASGTIRFYPGGTTQRMVLSAAGLLTVSGFGTHNFSGAGTGGQLLSIRNTTAGTGNYSGWILANDNDTSNFYAVGYSSTFTTAGIGFASGSAMAANGVGGLSIAAVNGAGVIRFYAGGTAEVMRIHATGGVTIGSPTGGDKGAGTLNAVAVYDDNVLLTDWVFDLLHDGHSNDVIPSGGRLYALAETRDSTRADRRLPWMPSRDSFEHDRSVGGMVTRLWFGQEQQQIYIHELEARIAALEAA